MPRPRPRKMTFAVALVALLAGCAPAAKPWQASTAPPPPPDPAMQKAQVECAELATRETENVTPQGQASKAALGIYYKCMTEKGYPPPPR